MKILKTATCFSIAAAIAALVATSAFAQEARPWLCRDKPVFSFEHSMEYQATATSGRQWRIFFMQFSPDAAHDGFDIVNSREISSHGDPVSGNLTAGRYFAVALYRQGGHWICPDYTHDDRDPKLGEVSNLCYGEDGPPCLVKLKVTPEHTPSAPAP
jgi:hypothetical protein